MATVDRSLNGALGRDGPRLGQRLTELGEATRDWMALARGAAHEAAAVVDLRGRIERHPYGVLLAAAGLGYITGGGLFTRLTARAVKLGLRLSAFPVVQDELSGLAEAAMKGIIGEEPPDATESRPS